MGLAQARDLYQALKVELDTITNLFDKYNLLLNMKKFVENKIKQTEEAIKVAPPPTNITELKTYYITDELYNRYTVDKDGNLTKV
jgi:uncharacterized UPF0160 family protein